MVKTLPNFEEWLESVEFTAEGSESLEECRERRMLTMPPMSAVHLEALVQLTHAVWDGYLISKQARSDLVDMGLATRWNGWQVITRAGLAVLETLKMLPTQHTSKLG